MDYRQYKFVKKEILKTIFLAIGLFLIIAKLFYGKYLYAIFLIPFSIPLVRLRRKQLLGARKNQLCMQFKDMILSMADSMAAGYSAVNAIRESYREMVSIYGINSYIGQELRTIDSRVKLNISLESCFQDFAERAQISDISLFSEVYTIAYRRGGNMVEVIKSVADNIRQQYEVREEIKTSINEKIYEQRIMSIVPIIIILYLLVTSPGFLDSMYITWIGRLIMTICLLGYGIAFIWGERIMNLE